MQSKGSKIRSLKPMQSSIFDRICLGTLHKTSSQNDAYIN